MDICAENYKYNEVNQGKSFGLSIIVHLLIVAVVISTTSNIASVPKIMVVDFSILETKVKDTNHKPPQKIEVNPSARVVKPIKKVNITTPPKPIQRKRVARKIVPIVKPKIIAVKQKPEMKIAPVKPEIQQEVVPEPAPEIVEQQETVQPLLQHIEKTPILAKNTSVQFKPVEQSLKPLFDLPKPAAGKSQVEEDKTNVSKYTKAQFDHIQRGIQRQINYPRTAQRMGWEGKVVVEFLICKDGTVKNIKIVESSGFKALDKNAIASIKKAAPFPVPPIPAKLIIPVLYRLG